MTLTAPAARVFTTAHITTDHTRTLCGQPMDADGLWQELPAGPGVPVCKGVRAGAQEAGMTSWIPTESEKNAAVRLLASLLQVPDDEQVDVLAILVNLWCYHQKVKP